MNRPFAIAEVPTSAEKSSVLGRAQAGVDRPNDEAGRFVVSALGAGVIVECTSANAPGVSVSQGALRYQALPAAAWTSIIVAPLAYRKMSTKITQVISSPAFSPGYDWFAYTPRWRSALLAAIGEPASCKVFGPGGVENKGVLCTPSAIDTSDGRVSFKLDQEVEVTQVGVTFSGKSAPVVRVVVAPCAYETNGMVPALIRGATRQRLRFISKQRACLLRLEKLSALVLGSDRMHATPIAEEADPSVPEDSSGRWVEIMGVSKNLALGEQSFQLKGPKGPLGHAGIVVLDAVTAGDVPKLDIVYRAPPGTSDAMRSVFEGASGVNDGIAVVTPLAWTNGQIDNTAKLTFPPLPTAAGKEPSGEIQPSINSPILVSRRAPFLRWQVLSADPADLSVDGCDPLKSCWLPEQPQTLTFQVRTISEQAIRVKLALMQITDESVEGDDPISMIWKKEEVQRHMELLEVDVALAGSARTESVPMPIRDRLYVDCRGAKVPVLDGETRAIADDDVVNGACALFIEPKAIRQPATERWSSYFAGSVSDELAACQREKDEMNGCTEGTCKALQARYEACRDAAKEQALNNRSLELSSLSDVDAKSRALLNPLFGPQRLLVTFKRDGAEIASQLWDVDPSTRNWLVLPKAADEKRGEIYDVEVRLAAKTSNGIRYRKAETDEGRASLVPRSELRYHVRLRSRGLFGFKQPWANRSIGARVYATIPVQLTGFRFPAAPSEVASSSDPKSFQYLTPRVGVLGVFEPWNYDTGQNPWPLNPSFSFGLLALELTKPRVDLSYLMGFQLKLPLGDASGQLSSSAALGLFYERDLSERQSQYGNRFFLTFGANVFSLFSGK